MADSTKPPLHDLPPHSRDPVMFRLGYLQSTCDTILYRCDTILSRVTAEKGMVQAGKMVTIRSMLSSGLKNIWSAASTLSVWGKVLMWLAPRALLMWGLAQGWASAAWRWLRWFLLGL